MLKSLSNEGAALPMLPEGELRDKVLKYEEFAESKLKP